MAAAAWASFHKDILPDAPGAPAQVVNHALLRTCQQFFHDTRAWSPWLDPTTTIADIAEYDIEYPLGSVVVRLERATLDGVPVQISAYREIDHDPTDATATPGDGSITTADRRLLLIRLSTVAAGRVLRVRATLKPSDSATSIPDELAEQFRDAIVAGTLSRLLRTVNRSYSNPDLGAVKEAEYQAAKNSTHFAAYKSFTAGVPRRRASFL